MRLSSKAQSFSQTLSLREQLQAEQVSEADRQRLLVLHQIADLEREAVAGDLRAQVLAEQVRQALAVEQQRAADLRRLRAAQYQAEISAGGARAAADDLRQAYRHLLSSEAAP